MRQTACLVIHPIIVVAMLHSLIARRWHKVDLAMSTPLYLSQ